MPTWIKAILGGVFFFGLILLYVIQSDQMSAYLDFKSLLRTGMVAGLFVGGLAGFYFKNQSRDSDARFSIFLGLLVTGFIAGPMVCSIINEFNASPAVATRFQLLSIDPVMESRFGIEEGAEFQADGYVITMKDDDQIYEITLASDPELLIKDDSEIILHVVEGNLGYRYIDLGLSAMPHQIAALPDCYKRHHS